MANWRKIRRASWVSFAFIAVLTLADVDGSGAGAWAERPTNGDWVAYATAPAPTASRQYRYRGGSDVFIVKPGGSPKRVAGRGNGSIWNVCPSFSPDGNLLAFAQRSPRGQSIKVVSVSRRGASIEHRSEVKVPGPNAPCPRWSTDGKRIAFLNTSRDLVVVSIDGATRSPRTGDPMIKEFSRTVSTLVSPDGALVARRAADSACDVVVFSRRDGSHRRVVDDFPCSYAIAGWSPDSRKLIVMKDMDGEHFAMVAVPVNAPASAAPVVVGVRVNGARSWPGYGDVSWQPKP